MADIKLGLYVTELIGMGVNGVTGDYSRGAAGFMIRDGALAEPVAEITIAGNLLEMFAHLTPANDLRFRRGTDSPTVRVDGHDDGGRLTRGGPSPRPPDWLPPPATPRWRGRPCPRAHVTPIFRPTFTKQRVPMRRTST